MICFPTFFFFFLAISLYLRGFLTHYLGIEMFLPEIYLFDCNAICTEYQIPKKFAKLNNEYLWFGCD